MTDNSNVELEIQSLKAELKSVLEIVKANTEAKVSAEKTALINELASLSAELNQDFKVEEYKDASLDSLRFNKRVLEDVLKTIKAKSDTGDLAGLVTRGDDIDELSAEQIEDIVIELIQLSFGLEPASDEVKELIRLERQLDGYTLRR